MSNLRLPNLAIGLASLITFTALLGAAGFIIWRLSTQVGLNPYLGAVVFIAGVLSPNPLKLFRKRHQHDRP